MPPEIHARSYPLFFRVLTGVEAGVLGGLAMLAWFFLSSALLHHSVWTIPNLLGAIVNRDFVLRWGFSGITVSGLALHLFGTGVAGLLFALVAAGIRSRRRVLLLGVLTGLVWFYVFNALVWNKLGSLAWVYSPPRSLLMAHVIFGLVLGSYPLLLEAGIRHVVEPAPPPPAAPEPEQLPPPQ